LKIIAHKIVEIFEIAGRAERLMPTISKPGRKAKATEAVVACERGA
jgi:hypothetical protein